MTSTTGCTAARSVVLGVSMLGATGAGDLETGTPNAAT
jgi:hypothetical protein